MYHVEQRHREHHVEVRARDIIERVLDGRPVEDAAVELKAKWPDDSNKAARRIAGHANAAGGVPILWLIGIDERGGRVTGASRNELADWYAGVKSEFDDLAPELLFDVNVPVDGNDVVALLFETIRAPYVVKNPGSGKQDCGPVEREVPWRQGTAVRSAKRGDLLRILSPLSELPTFDVLDGTLRARECSHAPPHVHWKLDLHLYVGVTGEKQVSIPAHKCWAEFEVPQYVERTAFSHLEFYRLEAKSDTRGRHRGSPTIDATPHELLVSGPGAVRLTANIETPVMQEPAADANIELGLVPHDTDLTSRVSVTLTRVVPRPPAEEKGVTVWAYREERSQCTGK